MTPTSGKTIYYRCPFVPAEWIAAHGLRPIRNSLIGEGRSSVAAGICPYAHNFLHSVCQESSCDAIVVTTLCDQMRRVSEWMTRDAEKPIFLLNVPSTWQSQGSRNYYGEELKRLGRFMVSLRGVSPSSEKLAVVIEHYDRARKRLRESRSMMSAREYAEAIAQFYAQGPDAFSLPNGSTRRRGVPIALIGGPIVIPNFALHDWVQQAGGDIVLDGIENGERTLPAELDPDRLAVDPFDELMRMYFDTIPDASRRPNDGLYAWLTRMVSERGVRGAIVIHSTWCDLWHAEVQRIQEFLEIPVIDLHLDSADGNGSAARTRTRIQVLMDMVR